MNRLNFVTATSKAGASRSSSQLSIKSSLSYKKSVLSMIILATFAGAAPFGRASGTTDPASIKIAEQASNNNSCYASIDEISAIRGSIRVQSGAEWELAQDVIVHTPGDEVFVGVLHPDAALFEQIFAAISLL